MLFSVVSVALEGGVSVHEGLVTPVGDGILLNSSAVRPPLPIAETPPKLPVITRGEVAFLEGYWTISQQEHTFQWVSGVYRVPPPGMRWVAPRWIEKEGNWIRVKGFWYPKDRPLSGTARVPALCKIEEKIAEAPAAPCVYAPGHWAKVSSSVHDVFIHGGWIDVDHEWTYQPADYAWDGKRYIFIPAYWDHPLEKRGVAFKNVRGGKTQRTPDEMISALFPALPDYQFILQEHFIRHPDYWILKGNLPSWWLWKGNTALSRTESWWLFWWWTHPGFPQPEWIDDSLAAAISPPSQMLIAEMKRISPPPFIMSWGAASQDDVMSALNKDRLHSGNVIRPGEKNGASLAALEPESPDRVPALYPSGEKRLSTKPGDALWPVFFQKGNGKMPLLSKFSPQEKINPSLVSGSEEFKLLPDKP